MNEWKSYTSYYLVAGIVIIVLIVWGIVFQGGFGSYGELSVTIPTNGSFILIDEQEVRPERVDGDRAVYSLKSGTHTVIHSAEGMWPWIKQVEIIKEEQTEIAPFAVFENSRGFFVNEEDEEFADILKSFKKTAPTKSSPAESQNGTRLWIDGVDVLVDDGETEVIVFSASTRPKYASFFKDRDDVYIIASGPRVFAIDENKNVDQNFMPIHSGTVGVETDFRVKNDFQLYVKNGDNYLIVEY